ncbi:hypothetical protein OHA74_14205 [Streptomyces phaeochromogenes]|uniref:hypothetical protein n=1 Tax=Streptomyces phaeochromogenes TaxID=1923 RepID=UPI002E2C67C9|nr:hypothetical protein [Streptomyces phaeochromogenes]
MRTIVRNGVVLAALAVVALAPATASADTPADSGAQYGRHVRQCAQTVGFSGTHSPGMHQGYAGWDGVPCAG